MKNKKVTIYILFSLVIGIWGYVIYVVISKFSDNDPIPISNNNIVDVPSNLASYRWKTDLTYDTIRSDSFFHEVSSTSNKSEEDVFHEAEQDMAMETYDPLAFAPAIDIQYLGFIENINVKQKIALVQIAGKQHYMKAKQTIEGYTVLSINPNEIKVKTDFQTLTISKQ